MSDFHCLFSRLYRYRFLYESEGIVAVIVALFDERHPEEICDAKIDFIERTPLREQISTDRFRGMQIVIGRIREFAENVNIL